MKYALMRCYFSKKGSIYLELVFDLWNYEYETGYEIKVTLHQMSDWINQIQEYVNKLCGHVYDISRWDMIIRNIKQKKLNEWVVFEEGEKKNETSIWEV